MKPETKNNLDEARKNLGKCAAKVSRLKIGPGQLSATEKEMIIAFGTARDWVRWASTLDELAFSAKSESESARRQGITESVRFNLLWTATNALFAKDSLLNLAASPVLLEKEVIKSELKRFGFLYNFAGIDSNIRDACLETINDLLSMECRADGVPGVLKADGTPTMWEVIYHKHMRPEDRNRNIGKIITLVLEAAQKKNAAAKPGGRVDHDMPSVDGPTAIYAARNWAVHGVLLTSFFRGSRQKYLTFVDNITLLLALALNGAARNFLAKI